MTYDLGVDLGTTYSAAAVHRDGRVEVATLGDRSTVMPSVVLLRADGTMLAGEAANRRGLIEPERVAREFKRRLGDPTPLLLGGVPYSAEALMARLLRSVTDIVAEREGGPPQHLALTHPANWGPYKTDLLAQAVRLADLPAATMLSEPEAAAISYASDQRIESGATVAVYDLGGGTFDAAVLRRTESGWELLGDPEGVERLGGIDFDEAVFGHVRRALGGALVALDSTDPAVVAGVSRLRQDCAQAKEALSRDTDVVVPVSLPGVHTEVRLTRTELEAMIRPAVAETITALGRSIQSASVAREDVRSVLLVGGSSRIPLVAEMVSEALGRSVAVDAHPKHVVAIGAAIAAANGSGRDDPTLVMPVAEAPLPLEIPSAALGPPPPFVPSERPPNRRRPALIAAGLAVLLAFGAGALALSRAGTSNQRGPADGGGGSTTTAVPELRTTTGQIGGTSPASRRATTSTAPATTTSTTVASATTTTPTTSPPTRPTRGPGRFP